ncbi:LysE family translocator [Sedimentitalea sp. JM2-8]|uniref:LysE family translocator n=1 Tax=Sedimentitalea xiamensis TaxID=3050037 RepID=A0ABT7FB31_9RHOB|nr:LysE family translocator [Sedimentitalea xiamensis]MDK3072243.1 LysE family translocator [Sedimentitalea xiamensis]
MVDPLVLAAFLPAALALNLTPGADMMFCMGQGLRSGGRASVAASAGIALGGMVHAVVAGLGLGATVAAFPWMFDVIRWIGVAYLLWLAWGAIAGQSKNAVPDQVRSARAFRNGLIVNLTNPKVILFTLAFVPQFVDPSAGSILTQFLIFGGVLSLGGFVINGLAGIFAGSARRRLAGGGTWLNYVSGGIFAALAVRLAVMERT